MFTTGRIIFVIAFVVVFAAVLIYSYRRDRQVTKIHFNKSYKILLGLVIFLIVQFIIVKIRKFM
jgi:hypothetical protein